MDIYLAKNELEKLKDTPKYESMLKVAGIITLLLEKYNIKSIIVGDYLLKSIHNKNIQREI